MLDLSIREWVPVKSYGGILLASNDEFLSKDFCNGSLPKKISKHFSEPHQKISNTVCSILFLSMPSHAMSNFIDRFQISCQNTYTIKNCGVLNFRNILQKLQQKFKTS